jgi:CheY-like chemotaxis protein
MLKDRVLIIEDDAAIRSLVTQVLEMDGYKTRAVSNGEEALHWLREHAQKPCLILLDLVMPVMRGDEFLEKVRAEFADAIDNLNIVVMSAASNLDKLPIAAPIIGRIRKPFNIGDLLLVVEGHCGRTHAACAT